jgi:hypothetical protein
MTPDKVLARHTPNDMNWCDWDYADWPCDAVQLARQLQEAQERVARLEAFAEGVAKSENDTAGTWAAARYALTGSLAGALDEMRRSAQPAGEPPTGESTMETVTRLASDPSVDSVPGRPYTVYGLEPPTGDAR